ncbi:MAG: 4Fe-4S binding protein [Endomicrobiia bacterium]|nr:4Fe-4S binding protein [Endomicrobiia bacterium]
MTPSDKKIIIKKERCKGCELCEVFCPRKAITMSKELNAYGSDFALFTDEGDSPCDSCGFCYLVCPEVAIEVRK